MTDSLIEIIGGLLTVILTGLGFYTRWAHKRIDDMDAALEKAVHDLDTRKANNEDVQEMKKDIKEILNEIKKFELETVKWQGQMEGRELNKPGQS